MYYAGIDPGADGAVVIISDVNLIAVHRIKHDDDNCSTICKLFRLYDKSNLAVGMEDLKALYGVRSDSTFSLGWACGFWNGVCDAYGLPIYRVAPKDWQAMISHPPKRPNLPRGTPLKDRRNIMRLHKMSIKQASVDAACKLFPHANIMHDGVADAVCIAAWMRATYKTRSNI